jgi:hypothetical protein
MRLNGKAKRVVVTDPQGEELEYAVDQTITMGDGQGTKITEIELVLEGDLCHLVLITENRNKYERSYLRMPVTVEWISSHLLCQAEMSRLVVEALCTATGLECSLIAPNDRVIHRQTSRPVPKSVDSDAGGPTKG